MRSEDGNIIYACLNGESEAFGILVDKYKAGIFAFIYVKVRNFHDAQDLSQDVFLSAYRNLSKLRRWESFSFWLYRIASNCCKRWLRNKLSRPDQEFIEDQDSEDLYRLSFDSYFDNELDKSTHEALNSLPEDYREVLILYYFGGMNSLDIASSLGISHVAVRHRLSRARGRLKDELIDTMKTAFEKHKLQAGFTFRIVESIRHIHIKPSLDFNKLPWGISLIVSIMFAAMGLISSSGIFYGVIRNTDMYPPSQTRILKNTEVSIDALIVSDIAVSGHKFDKLANRSWKTGNTLENFPDDSSNQVESETGDTANPVLDRGAIGAWDFSGVISPSVIFDGSVYKMWYRGNRSKGFGDEIYGIGYATSTDGLSWAKYEGNPVLTEAPEDGGITWFTVIFDKKEYKMWYTSSHCIKFANSPDGIVWRKYDGKPVLTYGNEGEWDSEEIYTPSVVFNGNEYKMWYTGSDGKNKSIGYATSPDGISWAEYPTNPILSSDDGQTSFPNVLFNGMEYKMWYRPIEHDRFGYATSNDGISWVRHPGLDLKIEADAWDSEAIGGACIMYDGTEYKMWYDGYDSLTHSRIGYASGPEPDKITRLEATLTKKSGSDTRIPYRLSDGAEVKALIYQWLKYEGPLVRTLDVGYKPAGDYTSKDKAIYWDGKDENGKPVPGGLYDCVIKAGKYTGSTRVKISR